MNDNQSKLNDLAALRKEAMKDDPHGEKKEQPVKKRAKAAAKPKPRQLTEKTEQRGMEGRKLGIHLNAEAVQAMREIEMFLIMEGIAEGTNHSAAIATALELTAEAMKENKSRIQELYESLKEKDGRRKKSA